MREAKRQLRWALAGVGREPTIGSLRKIALHARRSLCDEEMAALDPDWLAIPAQDEFSEDGSIESAL